MPVSGNRMSISGYNITNTHQSVPDPENPGGKDPDSPSTADRFNRWFWGGMTLASAGGLVAMAVVRRRTSSK